MGLWRGRLWCPVVPLLWAAAVGSIVYCVDAQADPVHRLKGAEVGKAGSNLSPIQNQIHEELQADHDDFGKKDETRLKQKNKEAPIAINPGLHGLGKASKRRVISKREAKKPKNTKRRVKFNKNELEKKLQQQEKEGSDLKTKSKEDSRVDTSEVLSSSNSLIPESGKKSSGSSSTYESYSESSDSIDENDIDDDDDEEDESIDASSDASDDKTEPTEEISLTSEQEKSKESKEDESSYSSLSTIQHSGPESSPPASSDSTDESSGSRAIPKSSSEVSYTMSSDASVYSSSEEYYEESKSDEGSGSEEETSKAASKSKEKSKSVKSTKKAKLMTKRKKKTGKGMKSEKFKGAKGDKNKIKLTDEHKNLVKESHANVEEQKSKTAETISQHLEVTTGKVLNVEKHENVQKLTEGEKLAQRLEITTGRVLNVKKNLDKKINHELQGTTEKVLRMSQNTVQKKVASRNVGMNPSSNKRTAMSDDGILPASKERPGVELLKVKKAEIDPKKKADLEQELIKDYPENGTVEIVNWQGTFAPIHGEPYVAPLHHQPDEFWDAIYTSKDPDLPTPPGAGISGETTAYPLPGPHMDMHRLAGMPNHQTYNQPDPSHFGRNPNTDHQPDPSGFGNNNNIEAKEKDKGEKNEKKKAKLTIKEKRKKKKEKKENPRESVKYAGRAEPHLELIPVKIHGKSEPHIEQIPVNIHGKSEPHVEQVPVNIHNNNNIEAKDKDKEKKNDKKKAKLTIKEKRKKKKEKKENPRDSVKTAGKSEPPIEHVPVNIHAKEKSEENLKTPSEEERESGTTYKPEGAYDYPYFRHPDFNPDTAYDEHGIPIHESPGWTPPPTLPGDNRFGKGRNQAGAGLKNRVNGPLALPQVAKRRRAEPKRLAVSVGGFHPEEKLGNNVHETQGLQDHMALLEHQNVLEGLHGLKFDPLHPLGSLEHLNLPLQHKEDMGKNNVNHRIKKRKASRSESVETSESSSEELDSEEIKVSPQVHQDQETAKERAYKLTEAELKNKEDSAPLEALNPALYSHRNMLQVKKKTLKDDIDLDKLPLDKLPINFDKLSKSSAEVIAVIVSKDGVNPKCHVRSKLPFSNLPPLPMSSPEVPEVYSKKNKNEGRNPLLYKNRNMLKISDLKDDGFRINKEDLIRQLFQEKVENKQNRKAITLDDFMRGPQGHTLKGRGRENFNPVFINEKKMFHVKTNKFESESRENHIAKREVKEALNPALYSYQNLFSSNPKQILPLENKMLSPKEDDDSHDPAAQSRFVKLKEETINAATHFHKPLFGGGIPIVDEDSHEKKHHSSSKQYMGKGTEAMNPFLVNFPNMFKVSFNSPKAENRGRNKENLNPLLNQHRNIFSADIESENKKSRKVDEALNPQLLQLTNAFGSNINDLHRVPLEKGKINPVIINKQKLYTEREKQAVLSRFKNVNANVALRPVNTNGKHQVQAGLNRPSTVDRTSGVERVKRDIDEAENKHHREPVKHQVAEEHNFKPKNNHAMGLGTPGAGRPKSLKRKTKDSEDSFASYFDGVDHNVVEEDESTPPPERTTGKMFVGKRRILHENARLLHLLTRKMRPLWRRELEAHNLSLDNTTVEFTNSMEEEINQAIEQKLLSGSPNDETMEQLTKELYNMIEQRKREHRPIGHILPGVRPLKDPLLKGVFEIDHEKQLGQYHLQYWPLDEPGEEARVLNGSIGLKDLKINLTHKHVSNKILKKILTIKPHYLSHSRADEVLNSIFPKPTFNVLDAKEKYATELDTVRESVNVVSKESSVPVSRVETKPILKEDYIPVPRGETKPVRKEQSLPAVPRDDMKLALQQESVPVPRGETKPVLKKEIVPAPKSEAEPVVKDESLPVSRGEVNPYLKNEEVLALRGETKPFLKEETFPASKTTSPIEDEFKKLRETISESRNISSILLDEVEARMNKKNEDTGVQKVEEEISQGDNWKLQQRIKDFKPSRPYHPTLPPFVRRWPTFRSKSDPTIPPETLSYTTSPETILSSTFLTMRPKYGGPRLKPPFFFSDFQRIGTVYPSTSAVVETETTTVGKLGWKEMCDLLGVGISGEVLNGTISPQKMEKLWASAKKMFTEKPDLELPTFNEEEKKYLNPVTTEEPALTTKKTVTTFIPYFLRLTRRQITSTTPLPSTTRRSPLHVIKHHVKTGFSKLLNFFGFGDVESEEIEENEE